MDTFHFDFDTDSTLSNDTNSDQSNLDWTAFQSIIPPVATTTNNLFTSNWFPQVDDAVAPDNKSHFIPTCHDDGISIEIDRLFNGLNRYQQEEEEEEEEILEPIHVNIQIPNPTNCIQSPALVSEEIEFFFFSFEKTIVVLASYSMFFDEY